MLLQESYPDITPVAGILATQFSTPLSHVNLRASAWGIPNAGDKKAREKFGKLDGKVVYYEVTDTAITRARGDRGRDQGARGARSSRASTSTLPQADIGDDAARDADADAREGRR